MNIEFTRDGSTLTAVITGRIDTNSAPETEEKIMSEIKDADKLVLDFAHVDYISSAGLRVLLLLHKTMQPKGGMKVIHINETVQEVLDITGFADILTLDER
ncbi:MAG: STAS domain-containing protein [Solobacterium sp.]|nr:STAS domain-containing protein [Solobacterium sp.]